MIIVKLQGGLGNQMFQYAAGRALSIRKNTILKFDLTHLLDRSPSLNIVFRDYDLDIFPEIKVPIATGDQISALKTPFTANRIINRAIRKTVGIKSYYKEKSFRFDDRFTRLPTDVYLDGFWQSEKYFEFEKQIIAKDFSSAPLSVRENFQLINEIKNRNSICLNVRRGDFVNHSGSSSFHGFRGLDYIMKAVHLIEQKVEHPRFYVFSDDVDWCRQNIKLQYPLTIVDHLHAGKKFGDYLQLMTACKHFIIPNSSFAWWAAWLNDYPQKTVIAPLMWFNDPSIDTSDITPPNWIRI